MIFPHQRLINPRTATEVFAIVPNLNKHNFPEGPVHLVYGRRNFGATHIWQRHHAEMAQKGFRHQDQVPDFVASIVKPFGPLHYEGSTSNVRLAVVQSVSGTAILQLFTPPDLPAYYSIVTAYLGFNRHGPRIGTLI